MGQPRWRALPILLCVVALGLLLPRFLAVAASNRANTAFTRSICEGARCDATVDIQSAAARLPAQWRDGDKLDSCQRLWLAAVYVREDPMRAARALTDSATCPRHDLFIAWGAAVYEALGMSDQATSLWSRLPPTTLIQRGAALVAAGRTAEGKKLLQVAADNTSVKVSASQQYALNIALGDLYRAERDWNGAARAYGSALSIGPQDDDLLYLLGMSLREAGLNTDALSVLLAGISILQADRPYFVSSYYIQLALTQANLGLTSDAVASLEEALEWELREFAPSQDQIRFMQGEIDRLKQH